MHPSASVRVKQHIEICTTSVIILITTTIIAIIIIIVAAMLNPQSASSQERLHLAALLEQSAENGNWDSGIST